MRAYVWVCGHFYPNRRCSTGALVFAPYSYPACTHNCTNHLIGRSLSLHSSCFLSFTRRLHMLTAVTVHARHTRADPTTTPPSYCIPCASRGDCGELGPGDRVNANHAAAKIPAECTALRAHARSVLRTTLSVAVHALNPPRTAQIHVPNSTSFLRSSSTRHDGTTKRPPLPWWLSVNARRVFNTSAPPAPHTHTTATCDRIDYRMV